MENLGELFEKVLKKSGNKTALITKEGVHTTYHALNHLSHKVIGTFRAATLQKGDVLCLFHDGSPLAFATQLACLQLGIVLCHCDPNNPAKRLAHVFQRCQPALIIGSENVLQGIGESPNIKSVWSWDKFHSILKNVKHDNLSIEKPTADDPAYIMFTSGSTGMPKGAVISHQNVMNFIQWQRIFFNITPDSVLTHVNPMYFDNAVFDFYGALFNGATLLSLNHFLPEAPHKMLTACQRYKATHWFSVPSLLIYLMRLKILQGILVPSLKIIAFGGEAFPKSQLAILLDCYGGQATLMNVYGPTECTCISHAYPITEKDFKNLEGWPPLGKTMDFLATLVLDESDQQVAKGEVGELCLLGDNVGLGYFNDPSRTGAVFLKNPIDPKDPRPLYRTGDLVKEMEEGFHFIGRKDNQIKRMGYRIELEEIEQAFMTLPFLSRICVVAKPPTHNQEATHHLVAYCELDEKDLPRLQTAARDLLPPYMRPDHYCVMQELPKNANGKVDRILLKNYNPC